MGWTIFKVLLAVAVSLIVMAVTLPFFMIVVGVIILWVGG